MHDLETTVLPVTLDDLPALETLINSAYRGQSSRKGWTTEDHLLGGTRTTLSTLEEEFKNPNGLYLKAVDRNGVLKGCVRLEKKADRLYVGSLTTDPESQGQGIGKDMLIAGEKYAKENGLSILEMTVIPQRTELVAWYERKGYRITGEQRPFPKGPQFGIPKVPIHFIVLEKELESAV